MSRSQQDLALLAYEQAMPRELNTESHSGLVDMFSEACRRYTARAASTAIGQAVTFAEIGRLSVTFAAYLAGEAGRRPGARIAIQLHNLIQYPASAPDFVTIQTSRN